MAARDERQSAAAMDDALLAFSKDGAKESADGSLRLGSQSSEAERADEWADRWAERLRDVRAFDAILAKHPDVAARVRSKGIDLEGEKERELARVKGENPGMSAEEASVRSSLAVYLRHEAAIREAAPDDGARYALDTAFEGIRRAAREVGMPYQESVRMARDISSGDKASILAATSASGWDARAVRTGDELRFDSPGDRFSQVWTVRPGSRPEKAVEIPNGPRISVAAAPEPDAALAEKRLRATDELAAVTGWE